MSVVAIAGVGGALGPAVVARLEGPIAGAGRTLPQGVDDAQSIDFLDAQAAQAWAEDLEAKFGGVRALLHLVGGWTGGHDAAAWATVEGPLIRSLQNTANAFAEPLKRSQGRFVMISSAQAVKPTWSNAAYAAAKAAAEAWTLALAGELKESGATANVLAINAIGDKPSSQRPEQIAEAIAFLLSDAGAKMNGQRLALHR